LEDGVHQEEDENNEGASQVALVSILQLFIVVEWQFDFRDTEAALKLLAQPLSQGLVLAAFHFEPFFGWVLNLNNLGGPCLYT
jgi:predicted ATPase